MKYKVVFSSEDNYAVRFSPSVKPKITFSSENNYSVKHSQTFNPKVTFGYNLEIMPQNLDDLFDVEISGQNDKYVLMYDAPSGKWRDVNPDAVLSASVSEPIQPGLPNDFENQLDIDLDNRIDLDAGNW
jgi:hypothetical protein